MPKMTGLYVVFGFGPTIEPLPQFDDESDGEGGDEENRRDGVTDKGKPHRLSAPHRSREVAKLSPDRLDRSLERTEGDGRALLQTRDLVGHDEVCDELW
jgi:hypothetical protein